MKSIASTCLVANKLDEMIEGISEMTKTTRQELQQEKRDVRRRLDRRIQSMEDNVVRKLDEMKRAEEERFSGLQSEIRSIFEKAFSEQWELMKHTITNDWKTSTKEVLQELQGGSWRNKVERSSSSVREMDGDGRVGDDYDDDLGDVDEEIESMFARNGGGVGRGAFGATKRHGDGFVERSLDGDQNSMASVPHYDSREQTEEEKTQLILQGYDLIHPACWPQTIPMPKRIPIHFTALSNTSNLNYETVTDSSGSARDVKVRLDLNALLCDITTTAGAPWLKIMRKEFGSETFNRDWSNYKFGFWDRTGEFWLGNEILHNLTSLAAGATGASTGSTRRRGAAAGEAMETQPGSWDLMIKMRWRSDLTGYYPGGAFAQQTGYAVYRNFRMASESARYSIDFGPRRASRNVPHKRYDGFYNHKDQFRIHGWPFTTRDRDNDDRWKENCAGLSGGGYWHSGDCCYTCLTTRYPHWYDGTGVYSYMQWIEMAIRPAEAP